MKKLVLTIILCLVCSQFVHAAPLSFSSALSVKKGEYMWRERFIASRFEGGNFKVTDLSTSATLAYGATEDFTLFGVVSYFKRTVKAISSGARWRNKGIGDAQIFGRYTFHRKNYEKDTLRIAYYAGLELPTGDEDDPILPTGSGSLDIVGGVVATYESLNYDVAAKIDYQFNNESKGAELGDLIRFTASYQYKLFPNVKIMDTTGFVLTGLESSIFYQHKSKAGGIDNLNSGGSTWTIMPTLQYETPSWAIEMGLQVPVAQNLNGRGLKNDYVLFTGFRVKF